MKIDKVLEAHGIGIVQLTPPVIPTTGIVTNGLVGYWNSKRGVNGNTWENIAPATAGQYNAVINGTTVTADGMVFDATTDHVQIPIPTELKVATNATFEMRLFSDAGFNEGYADIVNQEGRELLWIGRYLFVLSGIFDANKFADHHTVNVSNTVRVSYLTITADVTNNRITAYVHDPVRNDTDTGSYATSVGTMADGNFIWLSRTQTPFSGIIDGIRMYNRVLTQEEIIQNRTVGAELGIPDTPIILFRDDFNRADSNTLGDNWTLGRGSFAIENNMAKATAGANVSSTAFCTFRHGDNVSITADIRRNLSESLIFRATDAFNTVFAHLEGGDLKLKQTINSTTTTLKVAYINTNSTAIYRVRVELRGPEIKVYVNDTLHITHILNANLNNTLCGIHSWSSSATNGRFDSFIVETLVD